MIRFLFSLLIVAIVSHPSYTYAAITVDFTKEKNRIIPKGWELKEWKGKGEIIIENADGNAFIHLKSSKNSFALHKELNFNIKENPLITWKWKVSILPEGADVRNKQTDDQSAQLYIVFPKFPAMINSRLIGYIWETSAPRGTVITSKKNPNIKYIVLQSGKERLGEWLTEKRNVYADYKMLFNEEPPPVGKISIMIDSDDTKTTAESFFSAITFEKEPVLIAEVHKPIEKGDVPQNVSVNTATNEHPASLDEKKESPDASEANETGEIKTKKDRLAEIKSRAFLQTTPAGKAESMIVADSSGFYISLSVFTLISIVAAAVLAVKRFKQPKKE